MDPLIAAGALGAVTSTLRLYTNVMKLGSRYPLLLARQVDSVAWQRSTAGCVALPSRSRS